MDRRHGAQMVGRGLRLMPRLALIAAIRAYQLLLSPVLPPSCRFLPTCSHYAAEAIERHGVLRGLLLTLRRLGRCHPWGGSGYDPVPAPGRLRTGR